MKRMTCRTLALATMSLLGAALVMAQPPIRTNMEWTHESWNPYSYTTRNLNVIATIGTPFQRSDTFTYRVVSEIKGYGVYELGFRAYNIVKAGVTDAGTSLLAYGEWYSVNDYKDFTQHWKGYALLTADPQGFQLQGTTSAGYLYDLDAGVWGKTSGGNLQEGWMSFGTFFVQQQIKK